MASRNPISLLCFLFVSFLYGADTLQLPSSIHTVLLYSHQAEITRSVSGELAAGSHWLKVPRVSFRADAQSIRVQTPSPVRLNKVNLHRDSDLQPQDYPRLQKALAAVEKRQAAIHEIMVRQEGVQAQMDLLRANQRQDYSNTAQLEERARYFAQKMESLKKQALELQEALRHAHEAKQAQQKKVETLRRALQKQSRYWLLQVEVATAGKFSIDLRYRVSGASWKSEYQATRSSGQDSLELTHKALIRQNTGVPWQDVKLSLALGSPLHGSELPELPSFYIDEHFRGSRGNAPQQYMDAVKVQSSRNLSMETRPTPPSLEEKGTFRVYELQRPVSLGPKDPEEVRSLRRYTLPATYRYESHPVLRPAAFLQARISGFAGLPLPAGEVKRYNGDTYLGSQSWNPRLSRDTLSLSLGRDPDIQVDRKQVERFTDYSILGQKKVVTLRHEITVQNDKNHPITLLLREPVPVSRTEKVTVERLEESGRWDEEKGHLIYRLELAPGEKQKRPAGYRVTAPKDFPLSLP